MQTRVNSSVSRIAAMLGNVLSHYDNALFGLLAPFIANLFFDTETPITALILTYLMLPIGFVSRPLGSLFFGWLGDHKGLKFSLFCSLTGLAISTAALGLLPTYREIGIFAPILLATIRMLQSFCAAGESTGSAILVLEHTNKKKQSLMSSFYDASSMIGISLASLLVTLLMSFTQLETSWRFLFFGGALTAAFGVIMRLQWDVSLQKEKRSIPLKTVLVSHRGPLFRVSIISGLCYITYLSSFTFMNGFVPLITDISKLEVLTHNTLLLGIDMLLLPIFGLLAMKVGKERLMIGSSLILAIITLPLFSLLPHATLFTVTLVRLVIMMFGVAFSCAYHAWAIEEVPQSYRYTIMALGNAIGSQAIGAPCAAVSLLLYQQFGSTWAAGIYLSIAALSASLIMYRSLKRRISQPVQLVGA